MKQTQHIEAAEDSDIKLKNLEVILVSPRGFCAGVERAIEVVERAIAIYGAPMYVRHEIVHNKHVVEDLKSKGAVFVEELKDIPANSTVIFSAHGVSYKIEDEAQLKNLNVIDATCPLVTKVHLEAQKHEKEKKSIIMIGHKGHPEVEGTSGRVKQSVPIVSSLEDVNNLHFTDNTSLAYVTQTTLSVDDTSNIINALKTKFPHIDGPDVNDICYATQNRQNAVKLLTTRSDVILIIGSKNSSNSNRLRDIGEENNTPSYLIDTCNDIDLKWFDNAFSVGISAGASAPELLVQGVTEFLSQHFKVSISNIIDIKENVKFKLPKQLR